MKQDSSTSKAIDSTNFVDTHCHIHDSELTDKYEQDSAQIIKEAQKAGVNRLVCVGTDVKSSEEAVEFCKDRDNCYASVALHPHEAENFTLEELSQQIESLDKLLKNNSEIVAIGEAGLDYFYHDDVKTRENQIKLLKLHIELAQKYDKPMIFHIRDQKKVINGDRHAFNDFFKLIYDYDDLDGVVHSFTADSTVVKKLVSRGFYIGLNGIMTFAKSDEQLEAAKSVPLKNLVLETDAPFLTPEPFRGRMCTPKHLRVTAEFLSKLRGEKLADLARESTNNAQKLFKL